MADMTHRAEDEGSGIPRGWLILTVILGILILGDLNQRMADARRLEREAAQLESEVARLERENQSLALEATQATSDEMVEAWAHSEAKMVRQGERLIIPVPGRGDRSQATPAPDPFLEPPQNWQVWWALLFGG